MDFCFRWKSGRAADITARRSFPASSAGRFCCDVQRGTPYNDVLGCDTRAEGAYVVSSLHCMNDPQPEGHMASHIERRKFLATLGGAAAAWPLMARAQQPAMPVIGFLHIASPGAYVHVIAGFRRGLAESDFVE